jgi:hypothetical protein
MSTINSVTFNAGSSGTTGLYTAGDPVAVTVDYVPDAPSVAPATFTLTANITNAAGSVTATTQSNFTVDTPQAGGDTASVTDTGNHTWTEGVTTSDGSGGEVVTFSTTA